MDRKFGLALPPNSPSSNVESKYKPKSCEKLNKATGGKLKSLMNEVSSSIILPKLTFTVVTILWVMDESGDVYFAIEEVVDNRGAFQFLYPARGFDAPTGLDKLGHPSLICGGKGRIAGEIYFDIEANIPGWAISNKSGRYGLRKTTTKNHLNNILGKFAKYGITLTAEFIPGTR